MRLPQRHAWIVGAVDDEQRRADVVDVGERRRLDEEVVVVGERSVLALAERPPPLRGVLEERREAGYPHDVHTRRPELRLERKTGEHHVPAVGAAPQRGARRIEAFLCAQPSVERLEIADGVQPLALVVEAMEALAVARRSTHVRRDDGVAAMDEVLHDGIEARDELALGAAVDDDDNGDVSACFARTVHVQRDRLPVEGREPVHFRLDKHVPWDRVRAGGEPRDGSRLDVVDSRGHRGGDTDASLSCGATCSLSPVSRSMRYTSLSNVRSVMRYTARRRPSGEKPLPSHHPPMSKTRRSSPVARSWTYTSKSTPLRRFDVMAIVRPSRVTPPTRWMCSGSLVMARRSAPSSRTRKIWWCSLPPSSFTKRISSEA